MAAFHLFSSLQHLGVQRDGLCFPLLTAELREALHLAVGDLLEATIQDNVIILKPKVVIDREQAWAKMEHAMASVEDCAPNPHQSPQEQEEEIAEIIKEYRQDHAKRRT